MSDQAIAQLLELLPVEGPPGGELRVLENIRDLLRKAGVPDKAVVVDRAQAQSEYGGDTGNLIVRLDGHGRGARRLFACHMDTIPNAVGCQPQRQGERIVNGASGRALGGDNRTGCAIVLEAARTLVGLQGDHAPTTLAFLIQEEVGLVGARGLDLQLLGQPAPTLGFNFDGWYLNELITAVIGSERFTIDLTGVEAHAGAYPEEGVSCAVIAARALTELADKGWHGLIEQPAGTGTANLGIIQGGQGSNVVMPQMQILAEARSHDAAFRQTIIDVWRETFTRLAGGVTNVAGASGAVAFGPGPTYEAFALAPDEASLLLAQRVAAELGIAVESVSNNGGMDANWLTAHGIPTVTIGCGQRQIHTPEEWIDLDEFRGACAIAAGLARA